MDAAHEDARVRRLLAPLNEVEPVTISELRLRRPPALLAAAAAAVLLAIAGVAVAAGLNPFEGITAADHSPMPSDAVSPGVIAQLKADELPGAPLDQIGLHRVDSSRLVGTLPSGRKVYVVATTKDRLCVVVAQLAESCADPLTQKVPVTFTTFARGGRSHQPALAWGIARDEVVSVSFTVSGRHVTVPVRHNFFAYEGLPSDGSGSFSAPTVTFADGHTEVAN